MQNTIKISAFQLFAIITGFLFGGVSTLNYLTDSRQDIWLTFLISWVCAFSFMGLHIYIAHLNPGKTLIDILRGNFGKILGSILSLFYIWYFLHIAAITMIIGGEYLVGTSYQETPPLFIYIISFLVIGYIVKKGLEPLSRLDGIYVGATVVVVAVIFFASMHMFDIGNFLPMLERGMTPVLEDSLDLFAFPFGESVIFLMFFPFVNKNGAVTKPALLAVATGGFLSLVVILINLLVLGPYLLSRSVFPLEMVAAKAISDINIDALVTANFAIATGIRMMTCLFAATLGIVRLFNLDDHKFLVWPLSALVVVLTTWIYDSVFALVSWTERTYFFYALPFQVIVPILILLVSLVKKALSKGKG